MSLQHDEFIKAFKRVEQAIKQMPSAPADANFNWLEKSISSPQVQKKMQLCRMLRNYIQHESDYEMFTSIAPGMLKFLDGLYKECIKNSNNTYRSAGIVGTTISLRATDSVQVAAKKLFESGRDCLVCLNQNDQFIGAVTQMDLMKMLVNGGSGTLLSSATQYFSYNKENTVFARMDDLISRYGIEQGKLYVLTTTGSADGMVTGVIY